MSGDPTSKFLVWSSIPTERRRERGSDKRVGASSRCVKPLVGHHRQRLYLSCTSAVKDEVLKLSNDHHLLKAVWRSAVNPSRCQLLQKFSSSAVTTNLFPNLRLLRYRSRLSEPPFISSNRFKVVFSSPEVRWLCQGSDAWQGF